MKEMFKSKMIIMFIVLVLGVTYIDSIQENQIKSTYSTTDQSFRKGTNK